MFRAVRSRGNQKIARRKKEKKEHVIALIRGYRKCVLSKYMSGIEMMKKKLFCETVGNAGKYGGGCITSRQNSGRGKCVYCARSNTVDVN